MLGTCWHPKFARCVVCHSKPVHTAGLKPNGCMTAMVGLFQSLCLSQTHAPSSALLLPGLLFESGVTAHARCFMNCLLTWVQEAALMSSMRHANIVQFFGFCTAPPCVVTEYCSKGSLTEVLQAARRTPSIAAKLDWPRRLSMVRVLGY